MRPDPSLITVLIDGKTHRVRDHRQLKRSGKFRLTAPDFSLVDTRIEIGQFLAECRMADPDPTATKWRRLYSAFIDRYNLDGGPKRIVTFVTKAMAPVRYTTDPAGFTDRQDAPRLRAQGRIVGQHRLSGQAHMCRKPFRWRISPDRRSRTARPHLPRRHRHPSAHHRPQPLLPTQARKGAPHSTKKCHVSSQYKVSRISPEQTGRDPMNDRG